MRKQKNIMKQTIKDKILDAGFEDVIIFEEPSYEDAFLGVTDTNQAVYDFELMVEYLVRTEDMSYEEAADFISYNSSFYSGGSYPLILNRI